MVSISSDVVRKGLAGLDPGERRYEGFGQGRYDDAHTARTYYALLGPARSLLAQGQSVVLDASVPRKDASDGRLELLPAQKADFDPIAEVPSSQHLAVDTGEPMDVWLPSLCKRIRGGQSG